MGAMGLSMIARAHLRRHKGRTALMLVGLATAVAAFIAVMSLVLSLRTTLDDRLARYGASLIVTPASPELSLDYGGITVATAGSADAPMLEAGAVDRISAIPSRSHLAAVVPILLQPENIGGADYLVIGTDIGASVLVKPWWRVQGRLPGRPDEVLLGLNARNKLLADAGTALTIEGKSYQVSGVLLDDECDRIRQSASVSRVLTADRCQLRDGRRLAVH
jgi:putative ABC transport system permease protein